MERLIPQYPKQTIKEKVPWTLTRPGIYFSNACVVGISCGSFLAYLLLHGYCLDKYKRVIQMYSEGEEKPLNTEVQKRAEEVLKKCSTLDRHKNVKFFTVYGVDVFHAGNAYFRWGSIVGIPATFAYKSVNDVEKRPLQLFCNTTSDGSGSSINWSSEAGQKLLNSLVFSEKAQKFAIAQQLYQCYNHHVTLQATTAFASVFSAYLLSYRINRYLKLLQRPRILRIISYGLCSALSGVAFITVTDALTIYYERKADKKAANIDSEYLEGGIEYYEKCLSRNSALRELLGEKGKKLYTARGNDEIFIRTRHLPFSARLNFLKQMLEESKELSLVSNQGSADVKVI